MTVSYISNRRYVDTHTERKDKYIRRVHMCTWLGASLAGFIALIAVDAIPETPLFLKPIVFTLIAFAAFSAAFTRVGFEWEATKLKRLIEQNSSLGNTSLPDTLGDWPRAERWWLAFLVTYFLAGLALLICIWWLQVSTWVSPDTPYSSDSDEMPVIESWVLADRIDRLAESLQNLVDLQLQTSSGMALTELQIEMGQLVEIQRQMSYRLNHFDDRNSWITEALCKCCARK